MHITTAINIAIRRLTIVLSRFLVFISVLFLSIDEYQFSVINLCHYIVENVLIQTVLIKKINKNHTQNAQKFDIKITAETIYKLWSHAVIRLGEYWKLDTFLSV